MKTLIMSALVSTLLLGPGAFAGPIALPGGPLVFNYRSAEQYSPLNDINNALNPAAAGAAHGNWGIVQIDSIEHGLARTPAGWQIDPLGPMIFSDGLGPQILGVFYGVQNNAPPATSSRGGTLDLYQWDGASQQNVDSEMIAANLAKRSGPDGSQYTGFSCVVNTINCTFLARLQFTAGADLGSSLNTVFSVPGTSVFETYLSVDDSVQGAWTDLIDTDYFILNPAQQHCGLGVSCLAPNDVRVDGQFTQTGATGWDIAGTDIFGLRKQGAMRAYVVPAAGTLALTGLALALLAGVGARRPAAPQFRPPRP